MKTYKHTDHNTGKVKTYKQPTGTRYTTLKATAQRAARARQTARLVKMFN